MQGMAAAWQRRLRRACPIAVQVRRKKENNLPTSNNNRRRHPEGRLCPKDLSWLARGLPYYYTRTIITSVDLIKAAALSPTFRRISRTASAVIIDVIFWPPMESVTWAINPSILISVMRPAN